MDLQLQLTMNEGVILLLRFLKMDLHKQNEVFMRRAIELAESAWGQTHANPMVGALIVHNGFIVSEAYHERSGASHAEINALNAFKEIPNDETTLFITLEPCSTVGRTGACTEAIIRSGIRRIVVGTLDPNPEHSGEGIEFLKREGIAVIYGVLEAECRDLNLLFNHWIVKKKPFFALKVAMTLDGALAASSGHSKWITSEEARADVMRWRRLFPAILVSYKTVEQDNPKLTSRTSEEVFCPRRFVFNRSLKGIEKCVDYTVFNDEFKGRTTIIYGESAPIDAIKQLDSLGISAWKVKETDGKLDVNDFLKHCAEEGLIGVFIEAGAELSTYLLSKKLVDYMFAYQAPKLLLDANAYSLGTSTETQHMSEAISLQSIQRKCFTEDFLLRGYLS